jgi:glycosyltransferase involved in cell wall biosynthesis
MITPGKKSVLIDLERLKYINTGLGQVCLNFGNEISKLSYDRMEFTLLVPSGYIGFFGKNVKYERVSIIRKYFPFLCKSYNLWYAIHQDSKYFPSDLKTPYILTVHDLNFLDEKTESKSAKRLKKLKRRTDRAERIITISEFTRSILVNRLNDLKEEQIRVIYNGISIREYPEAKRPSYVPQGNFLVCLGVIRPKKNQYVLIDFIQKLGEGTYLILAGNKSSKYAEAIEEEIKSKQLQDKVILPGEISDEDKYWLYENAQAVVFPSLYEGMGMPPIEAMRFGKPVFVTKSSSIPEFCKSYAYYWESLDAIEMVKFFKEKTESFYADPKQSEQVKQYSKRFTWDQNIQSYLTLFEEVLQV